MQVQAAYALGQLGDAHATPRLLDFLNSTSAPSARVAAAYALDQLGSAVGQSFLRETLEKKDGSVDLRLRTAFLLGEGKTLNGPSICTLLVFRLEPGEKHGFILQHKVAIF